jgi:hypothetical protein
VVQRSHGIDVGALEHRHLVAVLVGDRIIVLDLKKLLIDETRICPAEPIQEAGAAKIDTLRFVRRRLRHKRRRQGKRNGKQAEARSPGHLGFSLNGA